MKNLLALLLLMGASFLSHAVDAPDFALKTESGEVVRLSDYRGKPLILHFWATWCPYCKKLQPGLESLYQKHKNQGLEVLAVSYWEDEGAKPQADIMSRGLNLKTVINGDAIAKEYEVRGTPTTFFINRQGQLKRVTRVSDPDSIELKKALSLILN